MANDSDSFINEVTEELRRDRLYNAFRRYGWIGILLIVVIVGGAAWREYAMSRDRAQAQAFGDAVLQAEASDASVVALSDLANQGETTRGAVANLLAAGAEAEAGDTAAAATRLGAVADRVGQNDPMLRDLARLKMVIAQGSTMDAGERDAILADLARPGAPFELLALEQQAIALVGAGRIEDAITLVGQIQQKDGLTESLRRRLSEMMIALGAENRTADSDRAEAVTMPPEPTN